MYTKRTPTTIFSLCLDVDTHSILQKEKERQQKRKKMHSKNLKCKASIGVIVVCIYMSCFLLTMEKTVGLEKGFIVLLHKHGEF